jgi:hypothetical protein
MTSRLVALTVALVTVSGAARPHAQGPTMAVVLKNAAAYLADFQKQLASIVSEETYIQEISPLAGKSSGGGLTQRITLKSDLLLVKPEGADRYVEFRDVFEVNGSPVRERGERLTALLRQPWATAGSQMAAIINESARYNIGGVQRNVNTPLLAMLFLDPAYQRRFEFKRASKQRSQLEPQGGATPGAGASPASESPVFRASTEMWAIEFQEKERPTIIRTPDLRALPVRGRFWINPDTGAVLISELVTAGGGVNTTITVSYQSEPLMGFLVPVEMRESYIAARERIVGTATYGRFRQVQH